MGLVIAYRPEQCDTQPQNERSANEQASKGGPTRDSLRPGFL